MSQDVGASKILQSIKAPATKFDNQISNPKTYMIEGKGPFLKPVLYTPLSLLHPYPAPDTHTVNKQIRIKNGKESCWKSPQRQLT